MDLNNVSILNIMSPNLAADKNVRMMAEAFDKALHEIILKIPDIEIIPNLMLNRIVNEVLIDLLAWQFHVDFYEPNMPIETKRELVLKSLDWHYRKGTPSVVEEIVSTVFSKAVIQEWYEYGGLPYRFRIATHEQMPDEETRNRLYRAINSVKNTRSFVDGLTQLVYLIDKVVMNEHHKMEITKLPLQDNFSSSGRLRRNGRFRRDGSFVNTEEVTYFLDRSGKYNRNAGLFRGENTKRIPSTDIIAPPFRRDTWEREHFYLTFDYGKYEEKQLAQALRNTSLRRDTGIVRDGYSDKSIEEWVNTIGLNITVSEKVNTFEQSNVAVGLGLSDDLIKRRDGTIFRDGKTYRGDKSIGDKQHLEISVNGFEENVTASETFKLWYMKHHFRDMGFTRDDGKLFRDSMVLIPLE